VPGRLAVVAVVAGTVFSAISGSTIATTAMLGSLMLPVMLARGYHPTMATGPLMAIGAVDMLIPRRPLTVLLGSLSGISDIETADSGSCRAWCSVSPRRLHHRAGQDESLARTARGIHGIPRLEKLRAVHPVRRAARLDFRGRGRLDVGGLGDADRIRCNRRPFSRSPSPPSTGRSRSKTSCRPLRGTAASPE